MYIDIILALVSAVSGYVLWQRISEKMPELAVMPDEEVSVMLQKNTAKLQVIVLHIFHFRSFYRERHYQDKFWNFSTKTLFKLHIFFLRLDNSLINLIKKIRTKTEPRQNDNLTNSFKELQEKVPVVRSKTHRINEIRMRGNDDLAV